jgi:hypothetical protein
MDKIRFPLELLMQGPAVGDLQDALHLLLVRGVIPVANEDERRRLSNELQRDHSQQTFGEITRELVKRFQKQRGLEAGGAVNESTADALNTLLREEQPDTQRSFVVSGQVWREDGSPSSRGPVRAFHEAGGAAIRLGEDATDTDGRYTIRYEPLPGGEAVNLRVMAISDDGRTLQSSELRANARSAEIVDLTVLTRPPPAARRLAGRVFLPDGRPVANLTLRVYRREFGGRNTLLAEVTTADGGGYAFALHGDSADAGLRIVALRPTGEEIPLAARLNYLDGAASVTRDLVVPLDLEPAPEPEFRRLAADLRPHVGEITGLAAARETADRQDITVLSRSTRWDARLLGLAALAARLSADDQTPTSAEAFYGLLRAGLPSDKVQLARVSPSAAASALRAMRDAGIIGLKDPEIDAFLRGSAASAPPCASRCRCPAATRATAPCWPRPT